MGLLSHSGTALLFGAISISTLHALIPSHWLSFAIVGRSRGWPVRRTLQLTALAGAGHILMTTALGLIVAILGKSLLRLIPEMAEHIGTGIVLIGLGIYFILPHLQGETGCHHSHHHDYSLEDREEERDRSEEGRGKREEGRDRRPIRVATREEGRGGQWEKGSQGENPKSKIQNPKPGHPTPNTLHSKGTTVMGALVMGMTLSPCLDLLSVFAAASTQSWGLIILIAFLMAFITLSIMIALVWITMRGLAKLKLGWIERYEGVIVGVVLILLGGLQFVLR